MTNEEYINRLNEIRVKVNTLIDDLGGTYSTGPAMLEKVLNVAMNGDFEDVKGDKVKTHKIISVSDYTRSDSFLEKRVYM